MGGWGEGWGEGRDLPFRTLCKSIPSPLKPRASYDDGDEEDFLDIELTAYLVPHSEDGEASGFEVEDDKWTSEVRAQLALFFFF